MNIDYFWDKERIPFNGLGLGAKKRDYSWCFLKTSSYIKAISRKSLLGLHDIELCMLFMFCKITHIGSIIIAILYWPFVDGIVAD